MTRFPSPDHREAIAADPHPSAARLRRLGASLAAYLRLQDRELCAVVARTVPSDELTDLATAFRTRS